MLIIALLVLGTIGLAYANGANDNFKGVATLFGSGTANYYRALLWATSTTFLGSLTAVVFAGQLLKSFRGKGLVDDGLTSDTSYAVAVALGAGLTVLLACRLGFPISTTHSLVGALVGAGWAFDSATNWRQLTQSFFAPLLLSPLAALLGTALVFLLVRALLSRRPRGQVQSNALLDRSHFVSAGLVSYARGLNDTPKIAALLLFIPALGGFLSTVLVGVAIALGGLLSARRVAQTMSLKITQMDAREGLTANAFTAFLILSASRFGLPVSTTHVTCGALFGIGVVTGKGHGRAIGTIVAAWLITLPCGALLGMTSAALLQRL